MVLFMLVSLSNFAITRVLVAALVADEVRWKVRVLPERQV